MSTRLFPSIHIVMFFLSIFLIVVRCYCSRSFHMRTYMYTIWEYA